jgi:hypothetical protein
MTLAAKGYKIGRRHVKTLMQRMGISTHHSHWRKSTIVEGD